MNNPENQWKKNFQDALSDYEQPGLDLSWNQIEAGVKKEQRKTTIFYWLGAVSTAAVLAIFFVSVFNVPSQGQLEEKLLTSNQKIEKVQTVPSSLVAQDLCESVQTVSTSSPNSRKATVAEENLPARADIRPIVPVKQSSSEAELVTVPEETETLPTVSQERTTTETPESVSAKESDTVRPERDYPENLPSDFRALTEEREKENRISASIFAGNPWNSGNSIVHSEPVLRKAPLYNSENSNFKEAALTRPFLSNATSMKTFEKHYQPIRYGVAVNFLLTEKLSIGTGFYVSVLKSESGFSYNERNGNEISQTLWYTGLPVNLNYRFVHLGPFYAYSSVGAMAEIQASGFQKIRLLENGENHKKHFKEHPWQFSANASIGIGLDLFSGLSLFVEPGIAYYFKNHSDIVSYYTDNRFAFNLNLGFRFSFD